MHVQVGVFVVSCIAEELDYICFSAEVERKRKKKKERKGCRILKLRAFKDSGHITAAYAAETCCWSLWQYRTPDAERVKDHRQLTDLQAAVVIETTQNSTE